MDPTPTAITDLISPQGEWFIEELLSEWRRFEARLPQPVDARVNALLDARGVRYYQTINLIPKPRRYQGRRAIYGPEHLLRLVCLRGLQAQGRALAEIQQTLERVTDPHLWRLAADVLGVEVALGDLEGPQASTPSSLRALLAYTLTPGVTLMVDPEVVSSPEDLVSAIAARISSGEEGEGD